MSCIQQQIDALMREWAEDHHGKGGASFISDGVVDADTYEGSIPKICFFLKEAYSRTDDGDWSLTDWLASGAMTRMWSSVAEWSYGIRHTTETVIPQKPQLTREEKTALLQAVAVVNVKKSNGAVASDYEDLLQYARTDQAYLKRELDILSPDVIVCGNNSSLLRLLYGASVKDNGKVGEDGLVDAAFMRQYGYAVVDGTIILDYYHPANQYPAIMNYYTVCGLYQQALKTKG